MVQRYKIADLFVEMDTFGRTLSQAEPYRYTEFCVPDIVVHGDWNKLKENQPHLSVEDCEYLVTGGDFYRQLLNFDGMMLHASAVVADGRAYLFSATSGTGKSTHTQLWCREFSDKGAFILNDDKPALRLENGQVFAYGTPWSGKTDLNQNICVPVAGICLLRRGAENKIRRSTAREAIFTILEQTARPFGVAMNGKLLDLLDRLLAHVPVWYLECNMDPQAAHIAYQAMSGQLEG